MYEGGGVFLFFRVFFLEKWLSGFLVAGGWECCAKYLFLGRGGGVRVCLSWRYCASLVIFLVVFFFSVWDVCLAFMVGMKGRVALVSLAPCMFLVGCSLLW